MLQNKICFISWLLLLTGVFMTNGKVDSNLEKENALDHTMRLLNDGQKSLNLSESRDIIIVVGNTGSGKTTFSHFIAGDNDKLISVKADDDPYSAEFLIEDTQDKISTGDRTTISKTIVPELIVDNENIVWYDCPGFSDMRNTTVEIATTFFVKNVIDHAERIKIVFAVNYASVENGLERADFDKMVRHGVQLISNIDRYKLSIALVATKANAYPGRSNIPLPHWVVANRTGSFIEKYRNGLITDIRDEETPKLLEFLNILLHKDSNRNYTNIGVFFRPDEPGALSKIPLIQSSKEEIRNVIKNSLSYSEVVMEDFGYTLSSKAQNEIGDLARLISQNITTSVENIGEQIISFYKQKETAVDNLEARKKIFTRAENAIADLKNSVKHLSAKSLLDKLIDYTAAEEIFIPKNDIENIFNQQKYLDFLDRVSAKVLPVTANDWVIALQKCFDYTRIEQNWYIVLVELYDILSRYDIQKDLELYDVAEISNWGNGGTKGIYINNYNFHDFLKLHRNFYDLLKDMEVDDARKDALNSLLNVTLRHDIDYRCEGDTLSVRREYLKASEIDLEKCPSKTKHLRLFAVHTFFADANLNFRGEGKSLAVIANKLDVPTKAVFSLQGNDSTYVPQKQPPPDKRNLAGKAGEPGQPGTNAANFVVLFNEVTNGDWLVVNAYGGSGSVGQDGGSSYQREPDRPNDSDQPQAYDLFGDGILGRLKKTNLIADFVYLNETKLPMDRVWYWLKTKTSGVQKMNFFFHVYSKCCEPDGIAGAGGIGGHGGQYTMISLSDQKASRLPNIINYDGRTGANGKNVEPCITKKTTVNFYLTYRNKPWDGIENSGYFKEVEKIEDERCPRAKQYTEFHKTNQKVPPAQPPLNPYDPINSYKSYLREQLHGKMRSFDLFDFYRMIEENSVIQKVYNIRAFANELQSYENHFYVLNDQIDFIPIYESFLQRVEAYSQSKSNEAESYEGKKVLAWLYTSALSKLEGLKSNHYTSLVIDIQKYFETSIHNINDLSDANKEAIINKHKDEYKKELDAKIEEATNLISKDITVEIDKIFTELDGTIDGLLEETLTRQNETEKDIKKLEKNKQELERNMKLRLMVGVFKGVGQCVSFIGPIGAAAGTAIQTASSIGESFIVDPDTPKKRFTLPSGIKNTLDKIGTAVGERKQKKIDALDKQIKKLNDILEKEEVGTVIGGDTKKAINNIKDALSKEKNSDSPSQKTIDELNNRFLELVNERKGQLKKQPEKLAKSAVKVLDGFSKALDVISTSVDLYNSYQDQQDKIDEIANSIKESKDELLKYQGYEQQVYESFIPMLNEAKDDLKELEKNLGGKSHVALDVQKWKVQSKLRGLKDDLVSFTKGFSTEETVLSCVEKLNEAIMTLIDIYDRIQGYEDQEKLVTYIGALHSAAFEKIQVEDTELKRLLTHLHVTIKSNIVLSQYLNAVNNFKQTVFPFASSYMDVYALPKSLVLNDSIKDLVNTATYQLESLSNKIKELNASSITKDDAIIYTGYFNGDNAALNPFFVWKQEEHKKDISNLLSGKKVYLRADVTQSFTLNAVKFSQIAIEFRVRNATDSQLQDELKSVLNRFHIIMTHMGNSYYRCNHKFYVVNSASQTISYSYEKTGNEPTTKNAVYEKLKNGNIVLSPYSMWSIQLMKGDIKLLEKYRNLIDIELSGFGQYVNHNATICNTNLEKYYRLDVSLSELNNVDDELLLETSYDGSNYLDLSYLLIANETRNTL